MKALFRSETFQIAAFVIGAVVGAAVVTLGVIYQFAIAWAASGKGF